MDRKIQRSITSREKISLKDKNKSRYKKLKDYKWGFGIEHETMFFHLPNTKEPIVDFIIYDIDTVTEKLVENHKDYNISYIDKNFLIDLPFEKSGRKCAGKWALKPPIDYSMVEFITSNPFSTLKNKKPIEEYCKEIMSKENHFIKLMNKDPLTKYRINKYGVLKSYPFGMTNYIKVPENWTKKSLMLKKNYKFSPSKKLVNDYTGSYHITITLPHTKKTKLNNFIKMHQNFANQIQWVEPLLIATFFSADDKSMGTTKNRIKGSYRVMRVGWGNLAGSDVRKFDKGVGRYSNIKTYWREGLDFYDMNKLKLCDKMSKLVRDEPGSISSLSSNFRTFGSSRVSGAGMTKPNGIEFRIFDHFDPIYLKDLCRFIVYIAQNSVNHEAKQYVYKNKAWINSVQEIMKHGWLARLPEEYIVTLRNNLGLKLSKKSRVAIDVMKEVNRELFKKNKNGDISYLLLKSNYKEEPKIPEINRKSWDMGFMLKLNNNNKLLEKFNNFIEKLPNKSFTLSEFENIFYTIFNKKYWIKDIENIIYFLENDKLLNVKTNVTKKIKYLTLTKKKYKKYDNKIINDKICKMFCYLIDFDTMKGFCIRDVANN